MRGLGENYGIATELKVSPALADRVFEPMAGTQLLRIIQEALTNPRKHARAQHVEVRIDARDGRAEATVQDDGAGFDPAAVQPAGAIDSAFTSGRNAQKRWEERFKYIRLQERARGSSLRCRWGMNSPECTLADGGSAQANFRIARVPGADH